MTHRVLFIITADPRTAPRAAEALRIAAGVGTWKKAEVSVYLRGPAVLALSEFTDELQDGDHFDRYLPIIAEWGRPVYVQGGTACLAQLGDAPVRFQPIDDAELATLIARSGYTLRF